MTAASAEMLANGVTTSVEMYFHPERIAAAVGRDRRPRDHRHPAAPAAGPAAVRGAAAGRGRAGRRRTARRHRRVRPRPARRLHGAAARAPRRGRRGPRARAAAAPARRRDRHRGRRPARRARRSRCPRCSPPTTSSAAGCWPRTACTWTTATSSCGGSTTSPSRTARPATRSWPAASRGCATCSTAASGSGWAPTGRRPTTPSTCSPTSGWPRRWPGWPGRSATALTAAEAFWLATGAAAEAIGRPDLGQLEAGRRADLVHVDTRDLVFEPVGDPGDLLAHLVWSGAGRHVRDVWVGGRQVVRDGASTTVDTEALRLDVVRPRGPPRERADLLQPNG